MRRREHVGARALAGLGLGLSVAYLVWRAGWTMHDSPWWLAAPLYAVELTGVLGAFALAWALWPHPELPGTGSDAEAGGGGRAGAATAVDVVVRVDRQAVHEVRATVRAAQAMRGVGDVVIDSTVDRAEVTELAGALDLRLITVGDRHGIGAALTAVRTGHVALFDAGDVPAIDFLDRLRPHLLDERVAVVQGLGTSFADDSPEHGPNHRHELVFERSSLNPALGRRGAAVWLGSGSLVRVDAVREASSAPGVNDVLGAGSAIEAHWHLTSVLLAGGWRLVAPPTTVMAQRSLPDEASVYVDRVGRAAAARRMVTGQGGALRRGPLRAGARLAHLAWAVRPLSGLRRMVFLAVLCGALLAGAVPFTARPALLVGLWLPAFCYTSLGLALLSGWTLRPGDRARWSLHTLGPALSSLGGPHAVTAPRQAVLASPAAPYGAGLTLAVVALSVVLVLRALSERVTHTLGELSQEHLMGLLVVSLWTLALSLDLLRVLARRAQLRRSPRVVAAMPASLGDRAVSVVDVTPLGAGVLSTMPVAVGEHIVLATSISTRTGVTDVTIPCVVRNAVPRGAGEYRVGVEFGPLEGSAADALAEFCSIEPMWERMGALPGRSITEAREIIYLPEPEPLGPGKAAVRIAALVAVAGAVGSSIPGTVEAAGATTHRLAGVVVEAVAPTDPAPTDPVPIDTGVPSDSLVDTDEPISSPDTTEAAVVESAVPVGVPGAIVVVVCAEAPGNDGVWGTADDVYGTPLTVETDADGTYSVDITGEACWATVAPPVGFEPVDPEVAVDLAPIDLSPSSGPVPTVVEVRRVAAPSPARGALGDRVWLDSNRNGLQDPDEDGVAGVQLTLLDPDLRVVARAVSTADGTFQFDGLTDGEYVLVASDLPDGLAFAPDAAGDDGTDSDVHPVTGRSAPVEIVAGRRWDNVDVGVTPLPADTATAPATPATPASADPERVLPEPAASDLAPTPKADSAPLAAVVLALAALLAGSILLGLVSPLVASRRRSRHVSGPALRRPPE